MKLEVTWEEIFQLRKNFDKVWKERMKNPLYFALMKKRAKGLKNIIEDLDKKDKEL